MKVLLLTPPLLQPNAPYAAMPVLAGFLRGRGVEVTQADLSLELVRRIFSAEGMDALAEHARRQRRKNPAAAWFLDHEDDYRFWIEPVVAYLQGKAPELGWRLSQASLPEGVHFRELNEDPDVAAEFFGTQGIADIAKMRASLFLDDVADLFRDIVDPAFGFSRYAEHLAVAAPTFEPIWNRLKAAKPTLVDRWIEKLVETVLTREKPTHVGITVPFPGTVYAAFRIAQTIRCLAPETHLVLGGGYVNSELRHVSDARVFEFFDDICFDEGFDPWLGILGLGPRARTISREEPTLETLPHVAKPACGTPYCVVEPDFAGLDLGSYISMMETANPMQRLWSEGRWVKLQLANGCYWHKCAFCDVALDYIGCYQAPDPKQAVDVILSVKQKTGLTGFHFTDEALSPALVRGLCEELLRRKEAISWWGNVRLDKAFTPELAEWMAQAGCIAVTAGLECANDRLLKLMNKGITIASARAACAAFSQAGIFVHTYLMYGFPTQTDAEIRRALGVVRDLFRDGLIQSAFWHRFALTVHSPIARNPEAFRIALAPTKKSASPCFALNEISYTQPHGPHPNLDLLGKGLALATYNFMRGQGLEESIDSWFQD